MENWENLNKILTMERAASDRMILLSQQLIAHSLNGEKNEAKKLLKQGAVLNCFEEHLTPLIACMESGHYDLAKFYVRANASITYMPNPNFINALWYALINKKHNFLELFIESKCPLTRHPETKNPCLIFATINSDLQAVITLLRHYNIKVNERDGAGNTAIHHNVAKENPSNDDIEIGRLLIAAGADTNLPNLDGKTPKDLAVDFAARAMLLSGVLEETLPHKDELIESIENEVENNAQPPEVKPGAKKLKI